MFINYILEISLMLLLVSVIGYIFSVIKEKLYLKKNIIYIDKKSVTEEHVNDTDIKEFSIRGKDIKSGDEVKVLLSKNIKITGIIIGANKRENSILLVTHNDKIKRVNVDKVIKIKIVSKYGKFFI